LMDEVLGADHLINRVDQTGAKEVAPQPIDAGAGKERIVRLRDPISEDNARIGLRVVKLRLLAVEELRLRRLFGAGGLQHARCARRLAARVARLHAGEEGGILPELLALPVGERMIVALRTRQPHTEEEAGRRVGEVLRLELLRLVETDRRRSAGAGDTDDV